jgi:hypothetical protein
MIDVIYIVVRWLGLFPFLKAPAAAGKVRRRQSLKLWAVAGPRVGVRRAMELPLNIGWVRMQFEVLSLAPVRLTPASQGPGLTRWPKAPRCSGG